MQVSRTATHSSRSTLSVLDAQRSLYAAEDLFVQSESSAAVRLIALYKALGGGWEETPEAHHLDVPRGT